MATVYDGSKRTISILKSPGFILMHLGCVLVIWSGVSHVAVGVCVALYFLRMIGITVGYHRYFSHRSFKTSRVFQFLLACLGATAAQQGPLWWASHHRYHHKYADSTNDIHSPVVQGFWWSHIGWLLCPQFDRTNFRMVPDLMKFRELRLIDKFYVLPPALLAGALFVFGQWLGDSGDGLNSSGFQMVVWGFFISTVLLYHGTFTVNSLAHVLGRRRFNTRDNSRNSFLVAVITLGEGWHNNHHYHPSSERQGFYWWELDVSHYIIRLLSWLRLVWDLTAPPSTIPLKRRGF